MHAALCPVDINAAAQPETGGDEARVREIAGAHQLRADLALRTEQFVALGKELAAAQRTIETLGADLARATGEADRIRANGVAQLKLLADYGAKIETLEAENAAMAKWLERAGMHMRHMSSILGHQSACDCERCLFGRSLAPTSSPTTEAVLPKARCGHTAYRGHVDMCIEDGCPDVAYAPVIVDEPAVLPQPEPVAYLTCAYCHNQGGKPNCYWCKKEQP